MKKTAIIFACILLLMTSVSCTCAVYNSKTEKARNLYEQGEIIQAIRTLDEAIKINDLGYEAYALRGNLYRYIKRYELAISDYKDAIARGGNYYNYPLGVLLVDIGRPLEAAEYLKEYIGYDEYEPEAYILLANIYEQVGEEKLAEEVREKGYAGTRDKRLEKHR